MGAKSFVAVSRDPRGKQVWHTIGSTELYKVEEARELARTAIKAIKAGESRAGPQSFEAVAELWLERHVEAKGLRTALQIRQYLNLHILTEWKSRDFEAIRRSDVAALLDKIQDSSGPVAADKVLAHISSLCNWYAARNDKYSSPIVRGMSRSNARGRARERILSDDELRAVWKQAETNGGFGAFIQLLLLTGQRRDKVVKMKWDDLTADGTWIIATEPREKPNAGELVLPQVALDIINAQPRLVGNPYVCAGRGGLPMDSDTRKKAFAAKLPPMPQWGLHDLRRTARSLMTRAGISSEVAERVLGHTIGGVEGIYNRHRYAEEKAHALRALAGLIDKIVNPPAVNVVSLAR
jgi:integrase